MIELYIDGKLVDLENDIDISLQKEFDTDEGNAVSDAEFSYTVRLPITDVNKVIFGFVDTFDVSGKFSRVFDARLVADGTKILEGKFRLSEVSYEGYKGNLYSPKKRAVSDVLGDRMLSAITPHYQMIGNLDEVRKINNYVANLDSSDIPQLQYRDRHICFPYVLWRVPYNVDLTAQTLNYDMYTQDLKYGHHTMWADNVMPSFNVLSVLKDVFATEGYRVIGNIFDDVKFNDLYQTMQYTYADYKQKQEIPYYLKFICSYSNYRRNHIPSTLQMASVWSDDSEFGICNGRTTDGTYKMGVDCPLVSDSQNSSVTIEDNEYHMLTKGASTNGYVITVPKSGWYRIRCEGGMVYPDTSNKIYKQNDTESVGGCIDEADNTTLREQPFEFQIKKGYPMESPKLYSFNSTTPCMPTSYSKSKSVLFVSDEDDETHETWIRCMDNIRNNLYGKNGKTTIVYDYSDSPTSDFICGARLGGAWFTDKWHCAYYGDPQRWNRYAKKGAMLGLMDVTKPLSVQTFDGDDSTDYYFKASDENAQYDYAEKTAQVLVRSDSYSNFEGYNILNWQSRTWDTSSNVSAITWAGAASSSASTTGTTSGSWLINTVVWLEDGDNVSMEVLMPCHTSGHRTCCHSRWRNQEWYINRVNVDFTFEMAIVNSDKEWSPSADSPIGGYSDLKQVKPTNVNALLPSIKCQDYLNGFLKTFNLKLTMPYEGVFSIDSNQDLNSVTNTISIDDFADAHQAVFKVIETPSRKELAWKVDQNESGYKVGNNSPYKRTNDAWDASGYSGNFVIENEANTQGSIDKTESQWSYAWYRDIRFRNGLGMTPPSGKCMVICDQSVWNDNTNWFNYDKNINTSKTMRLFYLGKNPLTSMYNYIDFNYDKVGTSTYKSTRLLLPSNYTYKQTLSGTSRFYLDYNDKAVEEPSKTLTDAFFSIKQPYQYDIETEITMSNDMYAKINGGTMAKWNGGLYKVVKVEGHDIEGKNPSTLTLRTLQ